MSWIVTRKATGEVIGEFFDRRNVDRFSTETCLIEDAAQYLGRVNTEINTLMDAKRVLAGINHRCTLAGRPKDQANLSCEHCPHCGGGCEVCR